MRLADIATLTAGYPFRGAIPEVPGEGVQAVQMKNVSPDEGVDWAGLTETRLPGKRRPDWLRAGDVLFAARGNHNYAVALDNPPPHTVCAPHFFLIRLKRRDVLPEFLAWQLNRLPLQRYFAREAEGTLTKSLRRAVVEAAPVAVPDLAEQGRIVALQGAFSRQRQVQLALLANAEVAMDAIALRLARDNR